MFARILLRLALLALAVPASAQQPRRQLEAHAHGEGKVTVAIEGNRVEMELEVPASDIVGFEHAPSNAAQRKALAEAKARLAKATEIVTLSPEAGCTLASASVDVSGAAAGRAAADGHGHAKGHADDQGKTASATGQGQPAAAHSEFRATYAFTCAKPGGLTAFAFGYFKAFKRAEKLTVSVIGPKGQSSFEVSPRKPVIELGGIT